MILMQFLAATADETVFLGLTVAQLITVLIAVIGGGASFNAILLVRRNRTKIIAETKQIDVNATKVAVDTALEIVNALRIQRDEADKARIDKEIAYDKLLQSNMELQRLYDDCRRGLPPPATASSGGPSIF